MSETGLVVGLTGATGHIGGLVLQRLLDDPAVAEVRSVARRALPVAPAAGARLVHIRADLRDSAARQAFAGTDLLYHLGAQVWRGPGTAGLQAMYAMNVDGTRNVLAAGPMALVLASSAAVYGAWADNPLPMDEAHEARPNRECPYALHKYLCERICTERRSPWAVVRLAAVLGPHADARVARAVRGYRFAVPAVKGAVQAVQWLDEGDAADGLVAAGRDLVTGGKAAGQVLNLAPSDWLSAGDAARLARSRVVEVPRRALVLGSEIGRRLRVTPFGADRAALIGGPLALSATKARQLLGWEATRTSAEVLSAALARDWHRSPRNRAL